MDDIESRPCDVNNISASAVTAKPELGAPLDAAPATWTPAEETAVRRKVDVTVIPMLMATFFAFQLDRANIGNALTDNFLHDVGITQDWLNVGQQLLAAGLILLEIPSNMVLYSIGPRIWITCQIIICILEAGFIPAGLYMLSQWYTESELSKRFATFYAGLILGQAVSGLLAYAILHLRGIGGLAGWQWLFLLEGIFTVLVGVLFGCFFPGTPSHPTTLTGLRYFSEREIFVLLQRKHLDGSCKDQHNKRIKFRIVMKSLANGKAWLHILASLCNAIPTSALAAYGPTIIGSFGFDALGANAMASVAQWISLVLTLTAGYIADRTGKRGLLVLVGAMMQMVFAITFRCLPDRSNAATKFGIMTMVLANCHWWTSVNASWLSIHTPSAQERSITLALLTMAINGSLLVGAQLFRSDDLPHYHRGWSIISGVLAFGFVCVTCLLVAYAVGDRRKRNNAGLSHVDEANRESKKSNGQSSQPRNGSRRRLYNV
ncbi:alternative sulfate transporter [Pseudomassariella vexata]|uniref:Alternative sulfate transporter n=1 Tax=Pseudomassariella vexata TaxID=1141098 RepID=A0A1Y2EIU8_9PEZI|nr:alternative sulfate transporter [Pseudomassariella vexata]ORY71367.1 alternative sulfate transporter [Pseudomassariella vexata]